MFKTRHFYLFHHVPKTAGSTISAAFETLGSRGLRLTFKCSNKAEVREQLEQWQAEKRFTSERLRIVYGHRVHYGLHWLSPRPPRYFTFLRSPQKRLESHFRFHFSIAANPDHPRHELMKQRMYPQGHEISAEEWYFKHGSNNLMVRFLAYSEAEFETFVNRPMNKQDLEMALRFLNRCWFVGFTENSEADIKHVCKAIGVRQPKRPENVSSYQLSAEQRQGLTQLVNHHEQLDQELYEQAWQMRFG